MLVRYRDGRRFGQPCVRPSIEQAIARSTTRGFLSNGVSFMTTIEGGDDNDKFTIFRNRAELALKGQAGDDFFITSG